MTHFVTRDGHAKRLSRDNHGPQETEHQRPETHKRERALEPRAETKGQDPKSLEGSQGAQAGVT